VGLGRVEHHLSVETILAEIADHAEAQPEWLELSARF